MAQARHRETSSHDTNGQFPGIETLWREMRPYAVKLRDIIMQNQTVALPALTLPPPSARSSLDGVEDSGSTQTFKIPSLTTRRAACTHVTMERLYGGFKCQLCREYSDFGWLYCCTQDDEDSAGDASPVDAALSPFEPRSNQVVNGVASDETGFQLAMTQLSPWIERAITGGHYTPEQVKILFAQKQNVVECTRLTLQRFEHSHNSNANPSDKPQASQSVDINPYLPAPLLSDSHGDFVVDTSKPKGLLSAEPKLKMYPHCKFRVCHHCRATYRDRAWQCFEHIFSKNCLVDPQKIESEERPLASVSLMLSIGLRKSPVQRPPRLRSFDSRSLYTLNEEGQIVRRKNSYRKDATLPTSVDIADIRVEPESKGFRESMKRAFKGMLAARRSSTISNLKGKGKGNAENSGTEAEAVEFNVGLWRELNEELLNEASSVPLPTNDNIDGFVASVEEIDIGGVAVTEEAAETGTADIILSV